ncbi:MAG: hypothetical protein JW794_02145 [Candidatus Cloacimonetes bacterium]|nr:hypothetical protein [Candidatus Cloacimonadota bacterium]
MKEAKRSGTLILLRVKPFIILLLCIIIFPSQFFAQDTWVKEYDPFDVWNSKYETYSVRKLIKCYDGYVLGGFYEFVDQSTLSSWGFMMKIDQNGNTIWTVQDYLDTGTLTFAMTSDEGFLCSGWERFTENRYLLKRDSRGTFEWIKPHIDFCPYTMKSTSDRCILLGGKSIDFSELVVKKLSESAEVIWSKTFSFNESTKVNLLTSIETSDRNLVLGGFVDLYGDGNRNAYIMKLDPMGNLLWSRTYDEFTDKDRCITMTETNDNKILAVGDAYLGNTKMGLFWLLDENGTTVNFKLEGGNYALGNSNVVALEDGSFICGGPQLIKIDKDLEIVWVRDQICGGNERKLCLTEDNGFMFPAHVGNLFIITKTDSLGLVYNDNFIKP